MFKLENGTLSDIPETMLWTLHNRAVEALRSDGVIDDDKAIEIYQSIDYDYEKNFGKAEPSHALRSLVLIGKSVYFWKNIQTVSSLTLEKVWKRNDFALMNRKRCG